MLTSTHEQGKAAEHIACQYLRQQGLRLMEKNFSCRKGEIDLIMQDKDHLVFIEVRSRKTPHFGYAVETITKTKQARIIHAAQFFLAKKHMQKMPCRFDVLAIEASDQIQWIKNAFQVDLA